VNTALFSADLPSPPSRRLKRGFAILIVTATCLPAQISLTALGTPVFEDFDTLGAAATASLPANWRMTVAGDTSVSWADVANVTATTAQASAGSPTSGGRYNWGQTSSDRAIGFMTSGSYASPSGILAYYSNDTGATIDQLKISFDYERYRVNTAAATISFFHSSDGTSWTAAADGDSGAFTTGTSAYGFTPLVSSLSKSVVLDSLNLTPGSAFYLRWNFNTTGGNSQGLGLDNVSVTASAIPEPSTYAALAGSAALVGAAWQRRRRKHAPCCNRFSTTPAA
jgi:hypothetical protein